MYGALPGQKSGGALGSSSTFELANQFTAQAESRWWEKRKDEPLSSWQELSDKSGMKYYYNVETKETTWEKPAELMTAEEMDQNGEWYWLPHETECFIPARITSSTATTVTGLDQQGISHTVKVKKADLEPLKRSSLQRVVNDLVLLDAMSPQLILHNLKQRFAKHEIYTNVGTILIAINPYCSLPLYTDEIIRTYARRKLGQEMPPHSFNIAHDAFVGLRDFNTNQSIIISGESGAGKTETTKHCLNYLAYMAGSGSNVAQAILKTNPILEAFGNAKTLRNDNSSRFGKYMQIFFQGKHCAISGCMVRNYLLEKIRVVRQGAGERNYHIFYMLTKGADASLKAKLHLQSPEKYNYIKTCIDVPTIDDVKEWKEVVSAFNDLKFTSQEQENIFKLVSAILQLGNLDFYENSDSYAQIKNSVNNEYLKNAAELLSIDVAVLEKSMITKELKIRNQDTTTMKLSLPQAEAQRDALAKFIYAYLFDWLVNRLNQAIGQPLDKSRFIGCLDIFGFEIFKKNSFEQLMINYTNEMLTQQFSYHTFKLEEAVYKQEGIKFNHVEYMDNQPMIDLINKRPKGLIPSLDEELIIPRGSDQGFLSKMTENNHGNSVFKRNMREPNTFQIQHYAGLVSYDVEGFLEKNRDSLTEDLVDMLKTSNNALLNVLFPKDRDISTKEKKASLGSQFSRQLDELMTALNQTEPHYIRCIKPNADKTPTTFVPSMCNEQLTYSGVYEAVAIRKQGFPFRLKHGEFVERYKVLFDNNTVPGTGIKNQCDAVISHMKLNRANVQMGNSMMLYRADEHKMLELHRNIKVKLTETQEDLERLVNTNISGFSEQDKEHYFIELAGAVRSADEFRLNTPISNQARKLLDKYVEERMDPQTKKQLQQAIEAKEMHLLEQVLRVCEQHGYQTSLVRQCQELLERITDAEAALRVAISEANEEYLQKAVDMCLAFDYTNSDNYKRALQLKKNIGKAKQLIKDALQTLNHITLKECIDFCAGFNYTSSLVEECQAKYKQVMHIRGLLENARTQVDPSLLKGAIDAAKDMNYDDELVYECELLHGRILRIDQEADRAMVDKLDKHIKAVLRAATEISYKGRLIKRLKAIADAKPEEYLTQQYQAAVKLGDHERAINLNIEVKITRVQTQADQLRLSKCPLLKEPLAWGKEKWFGSSTWRAETMLTCTDVYVHSPLTRVFESMNPSRVSALTSKVLLVYENIQKVMKLRNSKRLAQRTEEILMECVEYPEIRDEAYIGIMKFTTGNPDVHSVQKGFELLALCLCAFPPSNDLEDYLMAFILQPSYKAFNEQYNLQYLLCRIVYLNAITKPFWGFRNALFNIENVLNTVMPKQRPVIEKGAVPWEDLKIKFYDDEYDTKAREAYKKAKQAYKTWEKNLHSSKKIWEADLGERTKAAQLRQQGVVVSLPPPIEGTLDNMIPQSTYAGKIAANNNIVSNLSVGSSTSTKSMASPSSAATSPVPTVATVPKKKVKSIAKDEDFDDDDDDDDDSAPTKTTQKKKVVKKKGVKKASAPAPEDDDDFEEEDVPKKKVVKKRVAKKETSTLTKTESNLAPHLLAIQNMRKDPEEASPVFKMVSYDENQAAAPKKKVVRKKRVAA